MIISPSINQGIQKVAEQCGAEKAILFGSHARGTQSRQSDLDVIFIEQSAERFLDRLGKYMDGIWEELHMPSDVLVYTPEEFERIAWRPFIQKALHEGIVIYEQRKTA